MKKEVYVILAIAAILAVILLYQPEARKSIFTETLGDMSLVRYETGDAAVMQISGTYGLRDIPLTKGYTAVYMGRNGTMKILVVESEDHNIANDAFNVMNSRLGGSGGHEYSGDVGQVESHGNDPGMMGNFTGPVKVNIYDFQKPDVYMMQENNLYSYYYLKMDYRKGRVYWITFDHQDTGYQKAMISQAIMKI